MGVIYKITSPSGKIYVGKTYNLRKRINAHKVKVRKGSSIILHNSIRKYGWEAHKLEVIEEVEDSLLDEREIYWIAELKTYCYENPMGLNMTRGGDGQRSTWMHDIERRKRQSERFKGEGGTFYGKTHSEEWKKAKSIEVSEYNKRNGVIIPEWGVEKGRLKVIRAILCYDKYGNFLKEYESLSAATKELKIGHYSISESCNEKISGVDGKYVFRYKTPNFPTKIEVDVKEKTVNRPVLYVNSKKKVLKEYDSPLEASLDLKVPITTIRRAALYNGYKPIRSGHIFIYKDLHEKLCRKII